MVTGCNTSDTSRVDIIYSTNQHSYTLIGLWLYAWEGAGKDILRLPYVLPPESKFLVWPYVIYKAECNTFASLPARLVWAWKDKETIKHAAVSNH